MDDDVDDDDDEDVAVVGVVGSPPPSLLHPVLSGGASSSLSEAGPEWDDCCCCCCCCCVDVDERGPSIIRPDFSSSDELPTLLNSRVWCFRNKATVTDFAIKEDERRPETKQDGDVAA